MDIWMVLLIAFGLAMDVFAVSVGIGSCGFSSTFRQVFRLSFHFGLFQAGMTLGGWLAGNTIVTWIAAFDHWIAFGLLGWVGGKMLYDGFKNQEGDEDCPKDDPSRGTMLIALSVATSLDALAVGLSLAFLSVNILSARFLIGIVSSLLAILGGRLGKVLCNRFVHKMELVGGVRLIVIGIRILIEHLM